MTVDLRPTGAVVLHTDDSIEHIYLKGRDGEKLQQVVEALGASAFACVPIRSNHGVIAHAWIDKSGRTKELPPNRIGNELMGHELVGPIVVTGPSDETVAFADVPAGLRLSIDRLAREACQQAFGAGCEL